MLGESIGSLKRAPRPAGKRQPVAMRAALAMPVLTPC